MKFKFLIVAAALLSVPLLSGCNKSENDYGYSVNYPENSSEQNDNANQSGTAENAEENNEATIMYITINSNRLEVELAENSSTAALIEILKQNDVTYTADDYGGFEKVGNIGYTLPCNDEQITTEAGDVILYQGSNICLYYGVNTWSFTRIGKIKGYSAEQIKALLGAGSGSAEVTISLD